MATELIHGASLGESGRYRLRRLIGTGGMASVWLAEDERLQREVAVKVLSDVLALDRDYVARFEREARLAAGLSHAHLVNIFDFSAHDERPYLVMEYVAGGTLAQHLQSGAAPGLDPAVLARELLDALGYIHGAGIIHRDVKPANVLIGADGRARLTDFGIAQPSGATRITGTGQVIGTHRYIAPEVLRGQDANVRSDLYCCGMVLAECEGPVVSPALRKLISRLCAEDAQHRPGSAAEALALLSEVPHARRPLQPRRSSTTATQPRAPSRAAAAARGSAVRAPGWAVACTAAALIVLLLLVLVLGGSGGSGGGGGGSAAAARGIAGAPPGASLDRQLAALDRSIGHARR